MRHLAAALALAICACGQGIANVRSIGDGNGALLVIAETEDGALQALNFQGNSFELDLDGYAQEYRLVVTSGNDNVDAVFTGPSSLILTSPAAGQTFAISEGEDVVVEWEGADRDGAT